jgi:hypothetical protein
MIRAAVAALLVLLAGCTVASFKSTNLVPDRPKVTAVRVLFTAAPSLPTRVTTTVTGTGAANYAQSQNRMDAETARGVTPQFMSVFSAGFRDRFPELAARQGLTVSPGAAAQLIVVVLSQDTACYIGCQSKIRLGGRVFDAAGKPVWQFDTTVGQATRFSQISSEIFDAFANELLAAMRKDGVIGS